MKKILLPLFSLFCLTGCDIVPMPRALPHDFDTVISAWQKEVIRIANNIVDISNMPDKGTGQRNLDLSFSREGLDTTATLSGEYSYDTLQKTQYWKTNNTHRIRGAKPFFPLVFDTTNSSATTFTQTPTGVFVTLDNILNPLGGEPSELVASIIKALVDIKGKSYQIPFQGPLLTIAYWKEYFILGNTTPLFTMKSDLGESEGIYTYTISLRSDLVPFSGMEDCTLRIKKIKVKDFDLKCKSGIQWDNITKKGIIIWEKNTLILQQQTGIGKNNTYEWQLSQKEMIQSIGTLEIARKNDLTNIHITGKTQTPKTSWDVTIQETLTPVTEVSISDPKNIITDTYLKQMLIK